MEEAAGTHKNFSTKILAMVGKVFYYTTGTARRGGRLFSKPSFLYFDFAAAQCSHLTKHQVLTNRHTLSTLILKGGNFLFSSQ